MSTWLIAVLAIPGGMYVAYRVTLYATAARGDAGIVTSRAGRTARVVGGLTRGTLRWLARAVRRAVSSQARRAELDRAYHDETAREALQAMGNMKGVLMKVGQIVSFMDDTMPASYRDQLRALQSQAPPMDYDVVVRVIRDELGKDPERLFARFDREPVAAASIGQVHRALTRRGEQVAVKVQYPGVDRAIAADLKNGALLFNAIGALTPSMDARPIVEELRARFLEELDYVNEAANQRLFGELFAGHRDILIPKVYEALSSRRVLTTELVDGADFYAFAQTASPAAKRRAVLTLREFVFDSLYVHQVFNGDPHPGNYLFTRDGRVAFLDFGCVKHFDGGFMDELKKLMRLYIVGDRDAFFDQAVAMNYIKASYAHNVDRDWFFDYMEPFWRPLMVDGPFRYTPEYCREAIAASFGDALRKMNAPPDHVLLNRITFGLNAILTKLDACENWRALSLHYYFEDAEVREMVAGA